MLTGDTIAAVSSAPPPAERVVVRLSGPASIPVLKSLLAAPPLPPGRCAAEVVLSLTGGSAGRAVLVPAAASVFVGPHSYTGEDVVELGVPGSTWIVGTLLQQILSSPGVRQAEPGEFTARAFLNARMDLTAAEGVAASIAASDARQHRAARQLLSGELAASIRGVVSRLAELLALIEAGIDFSEEDISFVSPADQTVQIARLRAEVEELLRRGRVFGRLASVPTVALVGSPNAGKSTLLNTLAGKSRAVISPVAGTTRDVIAEEVALQRGRVRILDTAGLDDSPDAPAAEPVLASVVAEMDRRARLAADTADVLVRVVAPDQPASNWPLTRRPDLTIATKADLSSPPTPVCGPERIAVSARSGQGIEVLRDRIDALCFGSSEGSDTPAGEGLALTTRHLRHLGDASESLRLAGDAVGTGDELAAALLREALDHLGRITGEVSPDDVLGRVFSTFCIGK